MGIQILMQKSTKIKMAILSVITLMTVGTTAYQINKWSQSYNKMEQQKIQNFDTLWDKVWDQNSKTFTAELNQSIIQQLEQYAGTPSQQKKLKLAQTSAPLVSIKHSNSNLTQFIAAANQYYQTESADNDYPEQQSFNTTVLKDIEDLIITVNQNIDQVLVTNNKIDFDKSITKEYQLTPVTTNLLWKDLTVFNKHVSEINSLIKTQVVENNNKLKQEQIIQLKDQLDAFVTLSKQYESNIKFDYITIKDLKLILNTLSKIDPDKNANWLNSIRSFTLIDNINPTGTTTLTSNYNISLTDKFFEDNQSLKTYQTQLSQMTIPVIQEQIVSIVDKKSDESKNQTFNLSVNTSIPQSDNDLININSLQNISITIQQKQNIKIYRKSESSSTSSSSSNQSQTEPSTTTSSSSNDEPIPFIRSDQ